MRISKKKRQQLYDAIHEPIMDTRIKLQKEKAYFGDYEIAQTVGKIWDLQKKILRIDDRP